MQMLLRQELTLSFISRIVGDPLPHVHLLLDQILWLLKQPTAAICYGAYIVFCFAVAAGLSHLGMRVHVRASGLQLSDADRCALIPALNEQARKRGSTGILVVVGTIAGLGIIVASYLHAWSVDNALFGLIIALIMGLIVTNMLAVYYLVWRFYLLRFGYYVFSS